MGLRRSGLVVLLALVGAVLASTAAAGRSPRTVTCNGRWQPVQSHDHSTQSGEIDSLNAVTALSSSEQWAVGSWEQYPNAYEFHTLIEHWNPTFGAWTIVPSPNAAELNNYLYGVSARSSDDVWAVGGSDQGGSPYTTLVEHWDGNSWSIVPEASVTGVLFSVVELGPNDIWAVGAEDFPGLALIEHWDGTSWTATELPFGGVMRGVSAVGPNDVWAVGQEYGSDIHGDTTVTMHYDGSTWSQVASPNPLTDNPEDQNWLTSVVAVGANDVWAVGRYGDHDGGPLDQALVEHWNGSAWSVVKSPSPGGASSDDDLWGVAAVGPNDVWAVGGVGSFLDPQFSWPLIVHWNGSYWSEISPSTFAPGELLGVAAEPGGTGVSAVGDRIRAAVPYAYIGTLAEHVCPG
jgi:hypothetical protein